MPAQLHGESVDETAENAIAIDTGSSRNPRGRLLWLRVENRDAADAWIQFYDSRASDVTPGSNRFGPPIHVAPNQQPDVVPVDLLFRRHLSIFASSSNDGTGAPVTGLRMDAAFERIS